MLMWKDYFGPDATVVGVDLDERCRRFDDPARRVRILIGSQANRTFLREVAAAVGPIDILVDDGGHKPDMQIATFEELYPAIRPDGGVYVCEDMHTSYWPAFSGGLRRNGTFVEYAKGLVDRINGFQGAMWSSMMPGRSQGHPRRAAVLEPDDFTRSTYTALFYDSACDVGTSSMLVIEKQLRGEPKLITAGNQRFRWQEKSA
eukprot:SM000218S06597  [mRNA]  locus=s218:64608:65598:- [translate_table: standard]